MSRSSYPTDVIDPNERSRRHCRRGKGPKGCREPDSQFFAAPPAVPSGSPDNIGGSQGWDDSYTAAPLAGYAVVASAASASAAEGSEAEPSRGVPRKGGAEPRLMRLRV